MKKFFGQIGSAIVYMLMAANILSLVVQLLDPRGNLFEIIWFASLGAIIVLVLLRVLFTSQEIGVGLVVLHLGALLILLVVLVGLKADYFAAKEAAEKVMYAAYAVYLTSVLLIIS